MRQLLAVGLGLLYSGLSLAADSPFDDRGSRYNPMQHVRTIQSAADHYTLEFRNEEESYFTHFVVGDSGVVAFDPISDSAAQAYVDTIREKAPGKPLLAIVYSHLHTDHIAGARVLRHHFGKEVPIIAHERVRRFFERRQTAFIDLPGETVSDEGTHYRFGNLRLDLHYIGDAHTASILVPVVNDSLAYICDYASNDVVGWTDLPGIDLDEMMAMQQRTLNLKAKTMVFCHGGPGDKAAVQRQLDYFNALKDAADKALADGLTETQAAATISLPEFQHFANYQDWFKGNVRAMYRWQKARP